MSASATQFTVPAVAPKAIVFRAAIERSPTGKADYRWAREQAVSER
jgi:hypothetical protein